MEVGDRPKHIKYWTLESRINTFDDWVHKNPNKDDLARAGFFYTGTNDKVSCYFCSGNLHKWEPNDDPCVEHAKYYPNCSYMIDYKGQEFIDAIQNKKEIKKKYDDENDNNKNTLKFIDEWNVEYNLEMCIICQDNKRKYVLIPCGHFVTCAVCIKKINDKCPYCRNIITKAYKKK